MAELKKTTDEAGKDLPAPATRPRRGVIQFFREVRREGIDKVTWPTIKETWLTSVMVFIMVALTMAFFAIVDVVFQYGEKLLIGAAG